jgi:lipopolysaccharide transport system ATP-binding protein
MSSDLPHLPDGLSLRVRGLAKRYVRRAAAGISLKDDLAHALSLGWLGRPRAGQVIEAVAGVDLDARPGERIGILGGNGVGKSSLLRLLCRISAPTAGWACLRGRVASVLEIGTGFHPDLSGRENVYLNGALLGLSVAEVNRRFANIVDFAGIAEAIDAPVKTYSSGMYVRLAFSVAAHLDPDILIVDEALAVGDAGFRERCLARVLAEPQASQRTLLFVSHELDAIRAVCTRVVVMAAGRIVADGDVEAGIARYLDLVGGHDPRTR